MINCFICVPINIYTLAERFQVTDPLKLCRSLIRYFQVINSAMCKKQIQFTGNIITNGSFLGA